MRSRFKWARAFRLLAKEQRERAAKLKKLKKQKKNK